MVPRRLPGGTGPGQEYRTIKPPPPQENLDHEDSGLDHVAMGSLAARPGRVIMGGDGPQR
jgi:hypothetical protein